MKTKLNITIEEALLRKAKQYAQKHEVSLSQMIEEFLEKLTFPRKKKTIIELVDKLATPDFISEEKDLKQSYYEEQKEKHGF